MILLAALLLMGITAIWFTSRINFRESRRDAPIGDVRGHDAKSFSNPLGWRSAGGALPEKTKMSEWHS
jgi:hypothetical protein